LRNVCQVDVSKLSTDSTSNLSYYEPEALKNGLNFYIRSTKSLIYITDVAVASDTFHARAEATGRTYMYRILNHYSNRKHFDHKTNTNSCWSLFHQDRAWVLDKPLDITAMVEATKYLLGEQDFASFKNIGCQSKTSIRNVKSVEIYVNKQLVNGDNHSNLNQQQSFQHRINTPQYLSLLVSPDKNNINCHP
jgi:tRNA pseudouridine(38-40) synthase